MGSVFEWVHRLAPAGIALKALACSLIAIGLLLLFILSRRAVRARSLRRRDVRAMELRADWDGILSGAIPPDKWRLDPLDREIVETMLLDRMDAAAGEELDRLRECLRRSGLLDSRAYEARRQRGWRRRRALVSLGRMRVAEVVPALAEGLTDTDAETRLAAVRGLGRTGLPEGGERLLERVLAEGLPVPSSPLQNALLHCCRSRPQILVPYLRRADGASRELIARVLAEVATPDLEEELLLLASDPLPEVRASAARALASAQSPLALTVLCELARDTEWFVRLRAVAGLAALENAEAIPELILAVRDVNRYVRQRAAAGLVRLAPDLQQTLERVVKEGDTYALQAVISELDRSDGYRRIVAELADPVRSQSAAQALLEALREAAPRPPAANGKRAEKMLSR